MAALAAFAAGATLLQFCARLPPVPGPLALLAFVLVAAVAALSAFSERAPFASAEVRALQSRCDVAAVLRAAIGVLASAAMGFCYAAWRADVRLADALPPAWEDVDLRVTGIVDDLPQNDDTGSRFAFAVERVETPGADVPHRVSLAWHPSRSARDAATSPSPAVHAGERWTLTLRLKRPHGNVNPHGFDLEAWLLEHDLRATGYVRGDAANARIDAFVGRPGDYVQRAREGVRERIGNALPDAP